MFKPDLKALVALMSVCALTGCPEDPPTSDPAEPDAAVEEDAGVDSGVCFTDPDGDEDMDGRTNAEESEPWVIAVDSTGLGLASVLNLENREVSSDPCDPDSDGDGLDDLQEFLLRSDPGRKDTDGDGLDDFEEVDRWTTSPSSVDSDGDGRGCDGANPGVPNATMFDGAELKLQPNPDDPDAPTRPGPGATSPSLIDTDGDGICDTDEISDVVRSPIVADMPRLDVFLAEEDGVDVRLISTYEDNGTQTEGFDSTLERGQEMSRSRSDSFGLGWSFSSTVAFGFTEMVGLSGGVSLNALEASASLEARQDFSFTAGISGDYTMETSQSTSASLTNSYSRYVEASEGWSITTEVGQVTAPLTLQNTGGIAYQVEGLEVLVKMYDPGQGKFIVLGTMLPEGDAFSLSPGEKTQVALGDETIPAELIKQLMRNPRAISFQPANFSLKNIDGDDFKFVTEATYSQTALVMLDIGGMPTDIYRVATNIDRGPGGTYVGTTMGQLLDDAGIEYSTILNEKTGFRVLNTLEDWEVEVYPTDDAPALDALAPYPEGLAPGERWFKRGWATFVTREDGDIDIDVDFDEMRFQARDEARLVYVRDDDRDGIFDTEEFVYGASDFKIHSDGAGDDVGDGLSDYWEIRVGWTVDVTRDRNNDNPPPYEVRSSPALMDTDGDGWDDNEERMAGTDPTLRDTDGDNLEDPVDPSPLSFENTPPFIDGEKNRPGYDAVTVTTSGNTATIRVVVDDAEGNIAGFEVGWDASSGVENIPISPEQIPDGGPSYVFFLTHGYATPGVKTAGIRAYDSFGEYSEWAPRGGIPPFLVDGDIPRDCFWHTRNTTPYDPSTGGQFNVTPDANISQDTNPKCPGLTQDNMSMSAWVKLDASNATPSLLFGEPDFPAIVLKPGGKLAFGHLASASPPPAELWPIDPNVPDPDLTFIDDPTALPVGQWVHVMATLKYVNPTTTEMKLYRDGVEVASGFGGRNTCGAEVGNDNCTGHYQFGKADQWSFCHPDPYETPWSGEVLHMATWRRALSPDEVTAYHGEGLGIVCRL